MPKKRAPRTADERIERWLQFGVIFLVGIVGLICFYYLRGILLPMLMAFILAYVLNPLVKMLEARAVRRDVAVMLLTFGFTILFVGILVVAVPLVIDELIALRQTLPGELARVKVTMLKVEESLAEQYPMLAGHNIVNTIANQIEHRFGSAQGALPIWFMSHSTTLVMTILIPFFVFFILRDGETWVQKFFDSLPHSSVETVVSLVSEFNNSLGGYIRSLVIDAMIVGGCVAIGLLVIGLNYAILIGIITGIGNFIPYFGPVLGTAIALLAAIFQGGDQMAWLLLGVLIVFSVVKLLDDWILQPIIVGHGADVHPVLVVLSVFIGGHVLGIVGMVIAVPVTVIIQVTLEIMFERYRFSSMLDHGTPTPPARVIL